MISIRNLNKTFANFSAVKNASFQVGPESGITALLGPNGAGKTTTMRMIAGYVRPSSGQVQVCGIEANSEENIVAIKRKIGYLPENCPMYPEMLVSEYLRFAGRVRGLDPHQLEFMARSMIEKLDLGSHLYTPIAILSRGFRQRVGLAATLIHQPEAIILDEPTSGLDPNQIEEIKNIIRSFRNQCTLILSTHVLRDVEDLCDRAIIMNQGQVAADQVLNTLRKSSRIRLIARGLNEDIFEKLSNDRIATLEKKEAETANGFISYDIETALCPEEFFARIYSSELEIREFTRMNQSLESVFRQITTPDSVHITGKGFP